jgi:hypothetical protein
VPGNSAFSRMAPVKFGATGQCAAGALDVCNTPSPAGPVPLPYPNIGSVMQAVNTSVMVVNRPVVHKMSEMPMSSGDEAGVSGGVVSGMNMGKVLYQKGSSKVMIEGKPCEHHAAPTGQNGMSANIVGTQVASSQTKVLVSP